MKFELWFVLIICVVFLVVGVSASVSESTNYKVDSFSFSSGDNISSSNYIMRASAEGDFIGDASSTNYINSVGFWNAAASLRSCLNFSLCNETDSCVVSEPCFLNNDLCSGSVCDFANLTISSKIYVFYSGSDGDNLDINLSGVIQFLSGNSVVFFGKRVSTGGGGGVVNITVPGLFNTTGAVFEGVGGYSTASGVAGGDGGVLQINYWGLIRNFTDSRYGLTANKPLLSAGSSLDTGGGTAGGVIYNRDTITLINGARDVDINNDGAIDDDDKDLIEDRYNNISTDSTYSLIYDVDDDSELDVADLMRIGLQFNTR